MAPTLGYWKLRGLGQSIRLYMHYVGEPYTETTYVTEEGVWPTKKYTLGLEFPNLPYYIDGDVKLTQSLAILRYIANKHGQLACKTPEETAHRDMLEGAAMDLRMNLIRLVLASDFEEKKPDFLKNLPANLKQWDNYLSSHLFLTGEKVIYIDFLLYEAIVANHYFAKDIVEQFTHVCTFRKRIEAIPTIEKFMKSPDYLEWPLHPRFAKFGGEEKKPF